MKAPTNPGVSLNVSDDGKLVLFWDATRPPLAIQLTPRVAKELAAKLLAAAKNMSEDFNHHDPAEGQAAN